MKYSQWRIENIDLGEVFNYCQAVNDWALDLPRLQSIPSQLEEIVLLAFEKVLNRSKGAVGDLDSFEVALRYAEKSICQYVLNARESSDDGCDKALDEGRIYSAVLGVMFGGETNLEDEATLEFLLVFQLDRLVGLYRSLDFDKALYVFADVIEIKMMLLELELYNNYSANTEWEKSREARERAKKRHKATSEKKVAILAEWDATGHEYKGRADFARIVSSIRGVKYRTLYDWIAEHDKSKG
ncbi:hypothetical protein C4K35_4233 [Pseudomonas chlororaphis subsp. piscium]|uniref:hypothetical protein n=1 Tax=Pseudomonas chlororaphis TaxID=587753 RepID=UPI000F57940A|nr:hypothetical protein [Pseudomonas chlororaphis]AZC51808.1 hypothetical protein C4K35_4233 [Pseudomonas chlororaphis subsp. piscium]AZD85116.1 hypothetical protein C4K14_2292 [Pseudomonas chlororaphis subsp. aureofaciens]